MGASRLSCLTRMLAGRQLDFSHAGKKYYIRAGAAHFVRGLAELTGVRVAFYTSMLRRCRPFKPTLPLLPPRAPCSRVCTRAHNHHLVTLVPDVAGHQRNATPAVARLLGPRWDRIVGLYDRAYQKPDPDGDKSWDTMRDLDRVWAGKLSTKECDS